MKDPALTKEIIETAIDAFAENIRECFKKFPIPAGMTKREAADTFIRSLAISVTNFGEECNTTAQEYLSGIATSAFLVEHIDDIIAKVLELEGEQQTIIE